MDTNTTTSLVPVAAKDWMAIVDLVVDGVTSPHSKRAYRRQIEGFLEWYDGIGRPGFTKGTINKYRAALLEAGQSAASVNLALSAIRKLAAEAADNGYLDPTAAAGVALAQAALDQAEARVERARAIFSSPAQNSCSSASDVRWPAMRMERFWRPPPLDVGVIVMSLVSVEFARGGLPFRLRLLFF